MEFIYGTVVLVAAIVMLGFAKFVVTRFEGSSWIRKMAATETMALLITLMAAFGVAFLFAGLSASHGGIGYTEFAASLGVLALAVIGVVRVFRSKSAGRVMTAGASATPTGQATI